MKLSDIKTFVVGNPPPHYGGRYFVFVKLITDGHVEGLGEAYCVPFDPHLVAKMLVDVFDRYLRNKDPHHIESMWRRVYSAGFTQRPDVTMMNVDSQLQYDFTTGAGVEHNVINANDYEFRFVEIELK